MLPENKEGRMRFRTVILAAAMALLAACGGESGEKIDASVPPPLAAEGKPAVTVVLPEGAGPGLTAAGQDLLDAMAGIAGVTASAPLLGDIADVETVGAIHVAVVPGEAAKYGDQGYRIKSGDLGHKVKGITVEAATEVGAMYGLYRVAADLGVVYFHPEESFTPSEQDGVLPWHYPGDVEQPDFQLRGFHEHTQHPIPMSDFLLRPGDDDFREYVSNYLRWLARNGQNVFTFHLLKTVDLDAWIPYITDIVDEAHDYGIKIGPVLSFSDQQQHGFKLISDGAMDEDEQIRSGLDKLLAAGFDLVGFQIGTSEFTKPDDQQVLGWLETATGHLADKHSEVRPFAWIHTTCSLKSDDGGYFYHLPLQADESLGAFLHTTMFYTLEHPSPVYHCDDFLHQQTFLEQASGKRDLVYFPETAWWLGFDNNLPLAMPITGWSRAYDIAEVLPNYDVSGHVTFTTGREWNYWQYDHFLTKVTWDSTLTWDVYLESLKPLYGKLGKKVHSVLGEWTDLQKKHFYDENPMIYFYLAGELAQDEIGARAGIFARPPKVAFETVLGYDDPELEEWKDKDFDMLNSMALEYRNELDKLPETLSEGTGQQKRLYREVRWTLYTYVQRIEHAVSLYAGVIAAREWAVEKKRAAAADPPEEPNQGIKQVSLAGASGHLSDARNITEDVKSLFAAAEDDYRYPVSVLCRDKPESLTAYPFGYLSETSSAHFWQRRDDQFKSLIDATYESGEEAWSTQPEAVFFTDKDHMQLTEPADPMSGEVIKNFIPRLLFGITGFDPDTGTLGILLAQDFNANGVPDHATEMLVGGVVADATFEGTVAQYPILVRDATGAKIGELTLLDPVILLNLAVEGDAVTDLDSGGISAEVASAELVAIIVAIGGIDQEGAENLVKGVYGIDAAEELPEKLPLELSFTGGG